MSDTEEQGYKVLDMDANMDINTFLSQIDDYHIFTIRFTLKPEENTPEFRDSIIHQILYYISKVGIIQFYTVGYEELSSKGPTAGLPVSPHIHIHHTLQSAKYDFSKDNEFRNYKGYLRRNLQSELKNIGIPWGDNRLSNILVKDPKNSQDIFDYPLKQFKVQDYRYKDYSRGFTAQELNDMEIRATTKHDEAVKSGEITRKRNEEEGMSQFYRDLSNHLDLNPADSKMKAIEEIYKFYCKKNKPINPQTIEGYALLYLFKNNILDLKEFIRLKHKTILSA